MRPQNKGTKMNQSPYKFSDERIMELVESWANGNRKFTVAEIYKGSKFDCIKFAFALTEHPAVEDVNDFVELLSRYEMMPKSERKSWR